MAVVADLEDVVINVMLLLVSTSSELVAFPPLLLLLSLQCAVSICVPSSRGLPNTKSQIEHGKFADIVNDSITTNFSRNLWSQTNSV